MEPTSDDGKAAKPEQNLGEGSPTQQAHSEWEAFFRPRAPTAKAFLKALRTRGFRVPSEEDTQRIADLIVAGRGGFARLLTLLQALRPEHHSTLEVAVKLAQLSLQRYGFPWPIEGDDQTVADVAKEWLGKRSKARLSSVQRDALLVFVLLHWQTGRLTDNQVLELLILVVLPRPGKKRMTPEAVTPLRPTEVLLRIVTGKANLKGLLELSDTWRQHATQIDAARRSAERARDETAATRDQLQHSVDQLQQETERLREEGAGLERRIEELESHGRDLRTDFQHRLDEMRGRLQGALEGELSRWLQTAYEASTAEPPRVKVIQERLEMVLADMRRQVEWLRTSG